MLWAYKLKRYGYTNSNVMGIRIRTLWAYKHERYGYTNTSVMGIRTRTLWTYKHERYGIQTQTRTLWAYEHERYGHTNTNGMDIRTQMLWAYEHKRYGRMNKNNIEMHTGPAHEGGNRHMRAEMRQAPPPWASVLVSPWVALFRNVGYEALGC